MFTEKIDRWVTAATAVPVFGVMIKMALDKLGETITTKGAEKLQERIEKMLGLNIDDAKKILTDELTYASVISSFVDVGIQDELDNFEARLRKEPGEKAVAYVLFISQMVFNFVHETKKTINPAKGKTGPSVTETFKDFEEGIKYAKVFIQAMLRKKGSNDDETFKLRVEYLEGKNVFSLIKPKKGKSPWATWPGKGKANGVSTAGIESLTERIKRKREELASKRN